MDDRDPRPVPRRRSARPGPAGPRPRREPRATGRGGGLPAALRAVVVLRHVVGDLDVAQTAAVLGVSPEVVRTRTHRALGLLHTALSAPVAPTFAHNRTVEPNRTVEHS